MRYKYGNTKCTKKTVPENSNIDSCELVAKQDVIFIALHPPVIMETPEQIKTSVSEKSQVVSLAQKISIEKIASKLEKTFEVEEPKLEA